MPPKPHASQDGLPRPFLFTGPRTSEAAVAQDVGVDTSALHKRSATVVNLQPTPKRRRTDSGTLDPSRIASPATNLVMLQQVPAGRSHKSNVTKPVLSLTQNHSVAGIRRRRPSNSPSRVSADGRIKKPRPQSDAQIQSQKQSERITNALRSQLHPKVRRAVLQHCANLSFTYQKEIGIKVRWLGDSA